MDTEDPISQFFPGQEDVNLYAILGLQSSATSDDIRKAYRRQALLYHPDKHANASEESQESTSIKFQQIGFAYSVLSDEKRRARYDKTGRTDDAVAIEAGADGWEAYFADLFDRVTSAKLDEMKNEYQGSAEEIEDLQRAYVDTGGDIQEIMNHIPHSTHEDEARFITIISNIIANGELPALDAWERGINDKKARLVRKRQSESEAAEAEELAKELGVWDEFYGSGRPSQKKGKGRNKGDNSTADEGDVSALQALILSKRKNMDGFLDSLAEKYAEPESKGNKRKRGSKKGGSATKREKAPVHAEIDDEEFRQLQNKLFPDESKPATSEDASAPKKRARARKAI